MRARLLGRGLVKNAELSELGAHSREGLIPDSSSEEFYLTRVQLYKRQQMVQALQKVKSIQMERSIGGRS
jgi:hypothetical protein